MSAFAKTRSGLLVPSAYTTSLYQTPRNTYQDHRYRPRPYRELQDVRKQVTDYDRRELVDLSRQLVAGLGNISAAIAQKNEYAVGDSWKVQYTGKSDESWGQEMEEWINEIWYPNCDIRGQNYDFTTNLFLSGIAFDVDGDDLMVLAENLDTHFPLLQFLPTHRIGNGKQRDTIKSGKFAGAKVDQGVITDRTGRAIGYNVVNPETGTDQQISTFNCQLDYDPRWQTQNRGIPKSAGMTLDGLDVQDIDVFLKRGLKRATSVGLLHTNAEGQADTGQEFVDDAPTNSTNRGVKFEKINGGEDYYYTAGKGEGLNFLEYNNPTQNVEAYIARIERRMLLAIGWFYELLDPSKIGGASVRLIQDLARAIVRHQQKILRRRAKRAVRYAIAKGMKHGFISRNDDDWWRIDFEMPAVLTVDSGYDAQSDMNALHLGVMTEEAYHAKNGDTAKVVNDIKDRELARRIERAEAIAKKTGKAFEWVYQQLWSPSANPPQINPDLIAGKPDQKQQEQK